MSEFFEACDGSLCRSFGVEFGEVVGAGVTVDLAGAEDVPGSGEHRVRRRGPDSPGRGTARLGRDSAVFEACRIDS